MDDQKYKHLCARLDALLLTHPVTEFRLAVSRLHMVRNHPAFTDGYEQLFDARGRFVDHMGHWARRARLFAIIIVHLARVAANRLTAHRREVPVEECDVLIVSYLFSVSQAGSSDDVYFGKAWESLKQQGLTPVVLRFDSTPGIRNANSAAAAPAGHVLLDRFLPLTEEVGIVRDMWRESVRLLRTASNFRDESDRRLLRFASNDALTMWSISNLRRVRLVADVMARVRPKLLVTTFEGLPWERLVYARARTMVRGVVCAGYQQAPVFNNQHAIGRPLGPPYDPDVILASSEYSRRQLLALSTYTATTFDVLGSRRGGSPGDLRVIVPGARLGILVVPEGILDECVRMFGFVRRAAALLPGCTFTWRLHPNMTFGELRRRAPQLFAGLPANVTLSAEDFSRDIANAHVALYRGSSAILSCINGGLWPVYLRVGGSDDVDPLYELAGKIPRIEEPGELAALIQRAEETGVLFGGGDDVRSFAAHYYDAPSPDRLAAYVPAQGRFPTER